MDLPPSLSLTKKTSTMPRTLPRISRQHLTWDMAMSALVCWHTRQQFTITVTSSSILLRVQTNWQHKLMPSPLTAVIPTLVLRLDSLRPMPGKSFELYSSVCSKRRFLTRTLRNFEKVAWRSAQNFDLHYWWSSTGSCSCAAICSKSSWQKDSNFRHWCRWSHWRRIEGDCFKATRGSRNFHFWR